MATKQDAKLLDDTLNTTKSYTPEKMNWVIQWSNVRGVSYVIGHVTYTRPARSCTSLTPAKCIVLGTSAPLEVTGKSYDERSRMLSGEACSTIASIESRAPFPQRRVKKMTRTSLLQAWACLSCSSSWAPITWSQASRWRSEWDRIVFCSIYDARMMLWKIGQDMPSLC